MRFVDSELFKKATALENVTLSLAVAFLFAGAIPLQTYLGNKSMFSYTLTDLLPELLFAFLILWAVGFLMLIFATRFFGRLLHCFFVWAMVCAYLEVGILSIGLPHIDGTLDQFWKASIRGVLDLLVFMVLGGGIALLHGFVSRHLIGIASCLCVMFVAFVIDGRGSMTNAWHQTEFDYGFRNSQREIYENAEFGSERNVLFLVLDATPSDWMVEELLKDPEARTNFTGFVMYRNNIGMHDKTIRGVPGLATGEFIEKNDDPVSALEKFWSERSFVKTYVDMGYSVYTSSPLLKSFTNVPIQEKDVVIREDKPLALMSYSKYDPFLTLVDVIVFRLVPYREKIWAIVNALKRGNAANFEGRPIVYEREAYGILAKRPVSRTMKKSLLYFHTKGMVVPIYYDRNGDAVSSPNEREECYRDYMHFLFSKLSMLFRSMKEKGVYDKTMIVLATDHGCVCHALRDMPKSALLWVKPFHATGEGYVSDAPTTHCRVAELMRESSQSDLTASRITEMLSADVRKLRIRQPTPEKWWYFDRWVDTFDIFFDREGNEFKRVNLGRFLVL